MDVCGNFFAAVWQVLNIPIQIFSFFISTELVSSPNIISCTDTEKSALRVLGTSRWFNRNGFAVFRLIHHL